MPRAPAFPERHPFHITFFRAGFQPHSTLGCPYHFPFSLRLAYGKSAYPERYGSRYAPPPLIWRVIPRPPPPFCPEVNRPRPIDFKPYSPKDTAVPRLATPVLRPLCSLRNFLRLGCSISFHLQEYLFC